MSDPSDRRHRYPLINCTDCGPRATIIEDLPYDRVRTTMRRFPLRADCAAEYADPGDRRFHAEPVACPACGPQAAWDDLRGEQALRAAVKTVADGGIITLKGLGGYQLVCDAGDAGAVAELRRRKRRPAKPDASLAEAARIMARRGIKRLPVVDAIDLLQVVVSRSDLLKVFLRPDEEIADEVRTRPRTWLCSPTHTAFRGGCRGPEPGTAPL